jgi:glucose/arabinose dehydrogenase
MLLTTVRESFSKLLVAALSVTTFTYAAAEDGMPDVELQTVMEGLTSPVMLTYAPNDDRRFVVDRTGYVYILDAEGNQLEEPFLDISDQLIEFQDAFDERGLLGLAFHPHYEQNGRFYVYYSSPLRDEAPNDWNHTSVISEFKATQPEEGMRSQTNTTDMSSERVLLEVDQPQFNHDGGSIAFGPDGYLYIALGDGGAADDVALGHPPMGHGQDTTSLLGSILRLDVDRGWPGYAIPQDNPFVGDPRGLDEIHSWGWRNPWRMSFDRATGNLMVATNGQNLWEAVYEASESGNYGWNILEGTHCFDTQNPNTTPLSTFCEAVGPMGHDLKMPVIEYPHLRNQGDRAIAGISVIGGYVYRGSAIEGLQGQYVFGDWSKSFSQPQGQLLVAHPTTSKSDGQLWGMSQMQVLDNYILGFGEDSAGELYVLTTSNTGPTGNTGAVHKLVPAQSDSDS